MKPTLQNVLDDARAHLADVDVAGGQQFTNAVLTPFSGIAIRELFRVCGLNQNPFIRQEAFYVLPANTSVLDPATAGITNLQDLEWVESRSAGVSANVTNAVPGTNALILTVPSHPFTNGQTVVAYGIQGFDQFNSPNGLWTISVVDANTISLNGCTATGSWTGGGVVSAGSEQFIRLDAMDRIEDFPLTPGSRLEGYAWEGDVIRFLPAASPQQLRIVYTLSGNAPTNTNAIIGVDDSRDFLAARTAALAAAAYGAPQRAQALNLEALGPGLRADGSGGLLAELIIPDVRDMQKEQYRRPPFRRRRNIPDGLVW